MAGGGETRHCSVAHARCCRRYQSGDSDAPRSHGRRGWQTCRIETRKYGVSSEQRSRRQRCSGKVCDIAALMAGRCGEMFAPRGESAEVRLLKLREELPGLGLGPGPGAIVAAAVHVAGRVATVERTPCDRIAGHAALI